MKNETFTPQAEKYWRKYPVSISALCSVLLCMNTIGSFAQTTCSATASSSATQLISALFSSTGGCSAFNTGGTHNGHLTIGGVGNDQTLVFDKTITIIGNINITGTGHPNVKIADGVTVTVIGNFTLPSNNQELIIGVGAKIIVDGGTLSLAGNGQPQVSGTGTISGVNGATLNFGSASCGTSGCPTIAGACSGTVCSSGCTTAVAAPTVSGNTTICLLGSLSLVASSATANVTYNWTKPSSAVVSGTATSTITKTNVATTDAGNYSVVANVGNCYSATKTVAVTVSSTAPTSVSWTGGANGDWSTASNWTCGILPASAISAVIPAGINVNIPFSSALNVKDVSVANTSSLAFASTGTLTVYGNWSNAGTFTANKGTVEFLGATPQTVTNSSAAKKETFYNLTISKTNSTDRVTMATGTITDIAPSGSVNISKGVLDLNSNTFTLKSGALIIDGTRSYDNTARLLALTSSASIVNDLNFTMERYVPLVAGQYKSRMLGTCVKNMMVSQWAASFPILGGSKTTGFLWPTTTAWKWSKESSSTLSTYIEEKSAVNVNAGFGFVTNNTDIAKIGQGYKTFIGYNPSATSPYSLTAAPSFATISMKGSVQTGDVNVAITNVGSGWNFVSNPYPCEIDWKLLYAKNISIIANTLAILDPITASNGSSFFYCQIIGGMTSVIDPRTNGPRINPSIIGSSQGFFIKCNSSSSPVNLVFTESMKITTPVSTESNFRLEEPVNNLNISVTNGVETDNTFLYFQSDAKDGYDNIYDVEKMDNSKMSISTNTFGKKMAFNGIEPNFKDLHVPVIVNSGYKGVHTLTIQGASTVDNEGKLLLLDSYTNQNIELNDVTKYEFEIDGNTASSSSSRFAIISDYHPTITGVAKVENADKHNISLYPNPHSHGPLNITMDNLKNENYKVEIFDDAGVSVYIHEFDSVGNTNHLTINHLSEKLTDGIYTVKVTGSSQVITKKLVFHK